LEREVAASRGLVEARAADARRVAGEVSAAAELVRRNRAIQREGWVERRHRGDPGYAGPERRRYT
jgi:hypothetical protein